MRKNEWQAPLIALLFTWLCLGCVSAIVHHNRYEPPSKSFQLL